MILSKLAARLAKVSENLHEESIVGFDPSAILPLINAIFACLRKEPEKPVAPQPTPDVDTEEKRQVWADSYTAKQIVESGYKDGDYKRSLLLRTARQVKREQGKMTKEEKLMVARQLLDQTREMSHREVYEAALEAK